MWGAWQYVWPTYQVVGQQLDTALESEQRQLQQLHEGDYGRQGIWRASYLLPPEVSQILQLLLGPAALWRGIHVCMHRVSVIDAPQCVTSAGLDLQLQCRHLAGLHGEGEAEGVSAVVVGPSVGGHIQQLQ